MPDVTVLKETICPSLSATSDITYQIGNTPDGTKHIRITCNTGNGNFNGYWVPLPKILILLNEKEGPFIWNVLCPLFEGRSVNSACFLMAALKHEGLVRPSKEKPRRYDLDDPKSFTAKIQALMAPRPKKRGKQPATIPAIDPPADFVEATA